MIATDAGAMTGDRVVSGLLQGKATLGAHTNALNAWSTLYLNPGGDIVLPALSGIGSRYLTVNDTGRLVATMLPQAGPNSEGVLSSADWNSFENKFNLPVLTSGSVLISNGNSITENNANLFWNTSTNRLGIGTNVPNTPITVNSSNSGSGYTDWVAETLAHNPETEWFSDSLMEKQPLVHTTTHSMPGPIYTLIREEQLFYHPWQASAPDCCK
ncbi:MAG: hypothetical protein HWD58_10760 [Bacteroidota bacterium]|nr:MAG: hypothetical protein HWD58_10760 [Bacteroidota bacterium]